MQTVLSILLIPLLIFHVLVPAGRPDDPAGNRLSQTANGVTTSYSYDAADRLVNVNGAPYTWDDNGNLLSDGVNTYSYDYANRLTAIGNALWRSHS